MSGIKVGDVVEITNDAHYVEGTALRDYPGYHKGSRHVVVKITEGWGETGYHLVPEDIQSKVAYAEEIKKV